MCLFRCWVEKLPHSEIHSFISPLISGEVQSQSCTHLISALEFLLLARCCPKPQLRFSALRRVLLIVIVVSSWKSLISSRWSLSAPDSKTHRECVSVPFSLQTPSSNTNHSGAVSFSCLNQSANNNLFFALALTKLFSNHKLSQESCLMFFEIVASVLYEM